MHSFSFQWRVFYLIFFALFFGGIVASLLISWSWLGLLIALLIWVFSAYGISAVISRFTASEHEHFSAVLRDLHDSLETGRSSLILKSERPHDSFGTLAEELNRVVGATTSQIAAQLERNRDLDQTKTLFQSILGTMVEGVLVLDSQHRVLYFNSTARRLLDCTVRNAEGRPLWEVVRASELQEVITTVINEKQEVRDEVELQRRRNILEVTAAPLSLKPDAGVVVVLHDITELRRLEQMRREFVSNVSHELKTPLTSIQAYADTLLEGGLEDEENARRFVTRIIEQSARLQTLIQDMLRLARIESQSEAFQSRSVDVGELVKISLESRQDLAESRNDNLILRSGPESAMVMADSGGLQTIVDNLIDNALNATQEGGEVSVRWFTENQQVCIEVSDNGIGIANEHRERIFERFYRVDRSRARGMGGTGLGLSIVKHLTQIFNGTIDIESEVGRGSRFIIRLPRITDPAA